MGLNSQEAGDQDMGCWGGRRGTRAEGWGRGGGGYFRMGSVSWRFFAGDREHSVASALEVVLHKFLGQRAQFFTNLCVTLRRTAQHEIQKRAAALIASKVYVPLI